MSREATKRELKLFKLCFELAGVIYTLIFLQAIFRPEIGSEDYTAWSFVIGILGVAGSLYFISMIKKQDNW